jgi:hypothetical protein
MRLVGSSHDRESAPIDLRSYTLVPLGLAGNAFATRRRAAARVCRPSPDEVEANATAVPTESEGSAGPISGTVLGLAEPAPTLVPAASLRVVGSLGTSRCGSVHPGTLLACSSCCDQRILLKCQVSFPRLLRTLRCDGFKAAGERAPSAPHLPSLPADDPIRYGAETVKAGSDHSSGPDKQRVERAVVRSRVQLHLAAQPELEVGRAAGPLLGKP